MPTASALVLNVAFPEPLTAPVPRVVEPSLKVTLPVGVAPEFGCTWAVKVTEFPWVDGFSEETTVVTVTALLTVCDKALEVLVRKSVLPLNVAVMWLRPTVRFPVTSFATLPVRVTVPREVPR